MFAFLGRGNLMQQILISGAAVYAPFLALRPFAPQLDAATLTGQSPAPIAALALMIAGVVVIAAAQRGMGRSWRVGVPSGGGDIDDLVIGGIYRFSRNPIYLGIMMLLVGAAVAAPGPVAIGAAIFAFILISAIIRDEEKYLQSRFGAAYESYRRKVRRWV